jgi:carbonic anhydrase
MKCLLFLAVIALASARGTLDPKDRHDEHEKFSWGYLKNGTDWPGLCSTGLAQSPINIETAKTKCVRHGEGDARQYRIDFHYVKRANLSLAHNGNTLKVKGDLGYITLGGCNPCDGQEYFVKQFHFHSPSEHSIDATPEKDGHYAMELQIVHQKKGSSGLNDLVFVSVLFYVQPDGGFPNWFLESINWNNAPTTAGTSAKVSGAVDLGKLQESLAGEHWTYKGSLTTPPCSETVQWFIMKTPLGITKDQFAVIQNLFSKNQAYANGAGNNRATQPLNNREPVWYRRRHPDFLKF